MLANAARIPATTVPEINITCLLIVKNGCRIYVDIMTGGKEHNTSGECIIFYVKIFNTVNQIIIAFIIPFIVY